MSQAAKVDLSFLWVAVMWVALGGGTMWALGWMTGHPKSWWIAACTAAVTGAGTGLMLAYKRSSRAGSRVRVAR